MALTITASGDAKLTLSGTTTELTSIYSRLEFGCPKDGTSMSAALSNYSTQALYTSNPSQILSLDGFENYFTVTVDVATQQQSLQVGHEGVKTQLEALGYIVEIIDLT